MHIDFLILNQNVYAETAALSYSCSVFDETFFIAPEAKMVVSFRFLIPKLYLYMCMHQRFFVFFPFFLICKQELYQHEWPLYPTVPLENCAHLQASSLLIKKLNKTALTARCRHLNASTYERCHF